MRTCRKRRGVCGLAAATLLAVAAPAIGAGFQLNETSASGLGNAFAGGAAAAEDASTLWSNVAGMSRLEGRQAVAALHLIKPSIRFHDAGSIAAVGQPLGGNGGDAGGWNAVPNVYVVVPLGPRWSAGLGITSPWGLVTEYDNDWIGRFQAVRSSIKTINVNPAVSWKASADLALGIGLNGQRILGEFTNRVNYSAALLSAAALNGITPGTPTFNAVAQATAGLESEARIRGDDNAWGWNAGLLWNIGPQQRLGLHYRSSIRYRLAGAASFVNPAPTVPAALAPVVAALSAGVNRAALFDAPVTADVEMPPVANLSYFQALNTRWDVMADVQWTGWSTIQQLTFVRGDGSVLSSTPENWKDVWKLSVGTTYRPGGAWSLRAGAAFSKSPVHTEFRTPRLPDTDRTWLALGGQLRLNPTTTMDLGAAYLWIKEASIHSIGGTPPSVSGYGLLDGRYKSSTVILSGQLTWSF